MRSRPAGVAGTRRRSRLPAPFLVFVCSRAFAWVGAAVSMVVLPALVYSRTGSATLAAVLVVAETAPYLAFGLFAGAVADRWGARRVMRPSAVAVAGLLALPVLLEVTGSLVSWQLPVIAALVATVFVFFDAATFAAVPAMVPKAMLPRAQSRMSAVSTLAFLVAPPAAGLVLGALGPAAAMALITACELVSLVVLWRTPLPGRAPAQADLTSGLEDGRRRVSVAGDIAAGLRFLRTHRLVRGLTTAGFFNAVTAGGVTALVVVIAAQELAVPAEDPRLGLLFAASGLGTLAGTLLLPTLQRRYRVGRITAGAFTLSGAGVLALAAAPAWPPAAAALAVLYAGGAVAIVNGIVVRQAVTPPAMQARVNTTARMIAWGGTPFGAAIAGPTADTFGPRPTLGLLALALAPALVLSLRKPIRDAPRLSRLSTSDPDDPGVPT